MPLPARARYRSSTVYTKRPRPAGRFVGTEPAVAAAGTQTDTSSGSASTVTLTKAVKVGQWLAVVIAGDNNGTGGVSSLSSVTDSQSNTYTVVNSQVTNNAGSAAASGVTTAIYLAQATTALTTSDTVTVNWSPNTTSRAVVLLKMPRLTGDAVGFASATGTGTSPSVTASAASPARSVVVGVVAAEANTTTGSESGTSGGAAYVSQANITADTGNYTSSITMRVWTKVPMTSFTPTVNPTRTSADWAAIVVAFRTNAVSTGGKVKVYDGATWTVATAKVYNGSTWDTAVAKVYDGGAWVTTSGT